MCPGQFPSPTPSREASPEPYTDNLPVSRRACAADQHYVQSLDFTASASFRKRPRFSDSQSEPIIARLDVRRSIAPSPPTIRKQATDRRRASDPLDGALRARTSHDNKVQKKTPPRRVMSAQHMPSPTSPPSPNRRPSPRTPIQLPVSESSRLIDVRLREELRKPLTSKDIASPLATQDKCGVIYILKDPEQPERCIKIGWTSRANYEKRLEEHRSTCGYDPGYIHTVHDVANSYRAERLIYLDLMDRRKTWDCGGHHKEKLSVHGEWYDVTEEMAKETVNKWTAFMNEQRPYGWRKQLNPLWEYVFRTRKINVSENFDHEVRRGQWKEVLAPPTHLEYVFFTIDVLRRIWLFILDTFRRNWPYCTAFFWQISTLVYGVVTLIVCRNTVALSAFALISVCACFSVVPQLKLSLKTVRSRGL